MMIQDCNGTITLSCESDIVKNDAVLSKLEKRLMDLSLKYGLGDVLFMARNPRDNNSTNSFYIRAPKDWSDEKLFEVWDCVIDDSIAFLRNEGCISILDSCSIAVSKRY